MNYRNGTKPKGRPVFVFSAHIPLKPEHGLFGRHGPYGTENARDLLSVRIFSITFGTSDSSEDGFVNFAGENLVNFSNTGKAQI